MSENNAVYSVPMKGSGFYNAHSDLQREVLARGLDLLRRASEMASQNPSSPNGDARRIAEYGASHGRNSIQPLQTILEATTQPCLIISMNDRPENDFNSLALTMKAWSSDLSQRDPTRKLFITMLPRSFYEPLHHGRTMDLGYSFTCLHFLENVPCYPDSHYTAEPSDTTKAAIRAQAHTDLVKFLSLRAAEFAAGGTLVFSFVCPGIDHPHFFGSGPAEAIRMAMRELCAQGILHASDLTSCILPAYLRTLADVHATLDTVDVQQNWSVLAVEQSEVYHPLWNSYSLLKAQNQWTEQARDDYADAMVTWFMAVFEGFLIRAIELRASRVRAEQLVQQVKTRATEIFAREFGNEPVYLPSTFVLLQRGE